MGNKNLNHSDNSSYKLSCLEDLPYMATPIDVIEDTFNYLVENQKIHPFCRLIDLGSGDGRISDFCSQNLHLKSVGIEIDKEFITESRSQIRKQHLGHYCKVIEADLYEQNLSAFDLVFMFLIPTSHPYFNHVLNSAKSGTIFINTRWPLNYFDSYWKSSHTLQKTPEFPIYLYEKK